MDVVAIVVGLLILLWCFVGPLVGYTLRDRGWHFRSPLARGEEDEL